MHMALLRARAGLTQRELAARAGISERQIRYLEAAMMTPRWLTVVKLARALDVTEEDLVTILREQSAMVIRQRRRPRGKGPEDASVANELP